MMLLKRIKSKKQAKSINKYIYLQYINIYTKSIYKSTVYMCALFHYKYKIK